jgi:hypothetical protein
MVDGWHLLSGSLVQSFAPWQQTCKTQN